MGHIVSFSLSAYIFDKQVGVTLSRMHWSFFCISSVYADCFSLHKLTDYSQNEYVVLLVTLVFC